MPPIALFLFLAAVAGPAAAGEAAQPLRVTASVMARTSVQVHNAPQEIEVSEHDVARGFAEVQAPLQVAVHSNVPSGVLLQFLCAGEIARQVLVEGEGAAAGGAPLLLAWQRQPRQLLLRVKFVLAAGAKPGRYPWPLRVSAAS